MLYQSINIHYKDRAVKSTLHLDEQILVLEYRLIAHSLNPVPENIGLSCIHSIFCYILLDHDKTNYTSSAYSFFTHLVISTYHSYANSAVADQIRARGGKNAPPPTKNTKKYGRINISNIVTLQCNLRRKT